ncbi:conserved protein of unknown function [Rhodovastum atsumiense]|uniref:Uncharacterized protein n=1 Tax=Rhodovastum atsumiense TaxID=504468 RepID=A0A5M6J1T3_9PROT|nr:hypothetical protein [Rhodovastum atsumiense]KAA5614189.1 hypothetical protein F1189_03075 [Rhodovastum atsumiense]CAH2599049.1 conserved protein of unknown function [Rhodovastum atsumiense]
MPDSTIKNIFSFLYKYKNSNDSYFGWVVDDGSRSLKVGQTIAGGNGSYTIVGRSPADNIPSGTVKVASYFSAGTARTWGTLGQPSYFLTPSGTAGLGSERESLLTEGEPRFSPSAPVGMPPGRTLKYRYVFNYADGNSYSGVVIDDGSYGYRPGKVIPTPFGSYLVTDAAGFEEPSSGYVSVSSYTDARTATTYTARQFDYKFLGLNGLGSEQYMVPDATGDQTYSGKFGPEPQLPSSPRGATYVWIGGARGAFASPGNWRNIATGRTATTAPGRNDAIWFTAGTAEVTGAVDVFSMVVRNGAQVTLRGTPQDTDRFGAVDIVGGGRLTVRGAKLGAGAKVVVGAGSVLDISQRTVLLPSQDDLDAGRLESLTLQAPAGSGRPGGKLVLGSGDLALNSVYGPDNQNAGHGNGFDPRAGISGTGDFLPPYTDQPEPVVTPLSNPTDSQHPLTRIDFGTVHVGDTTVKGFAIENLSGNGGPSVHGAIQTTAHGGSVTDPGLSGAGVTAQDFSIGGRGGHLEYPMTLHATKAGSLKGQSVHVAYQTALDAYGRIPGSTTYFDVGQTLPITGKVLNHAAPAFLRQSGQGTLTHSGNAWTLDLGMVHAGGADKVVSLAVANTAAGPADLLSGRFAVSGFPGILMSGASPFAGIGAGQARGGLKVRASASATPGPHSAILVLHSTGSNASGYSKALADQILTVRDVVAA